MSLALVLKPARATLASMVAGAWHDRLGRCIEQWCIAHRQAEGRRSLERLNDHLLRDIGLTRWNLESL